MTASRLPTVRRQVRANPSIERTCSSGRCPLPHAAHVKRLRLCKNSRARRDDHDARNSTSQIALYSTIGRRARVKGPLYIYLVDPSRGYCTVSLGPSIRALTDDAANDAIRSE